MYKNLEDLRTSIVINVTVPGEEEFSPSSSLNSSNLISTMMVDFKVSRCGAVSKLVRVILWSEYIRDPAGLQVPVTAIACYGIISLIKQETYTQLLSTQEYK